MTEKICDFCGEPIAGGLQEHDFATCAHNLKDKAEQLEAELETYKHEVSVLRQLLDDDGTLALKTIEQQEREIIQLKAENERLEQVELGARSALIWYQRQFPDCIKATVTLNEMNKILGDEQNEKK